MYPEYVAVLNLVRDLLTAMGSEVPPETEELRQVEPDLHLATAQLYARAPQHGYVPITNACYAALTHPRATPGQQIAALGLMLHTLTLNPALAERNSDDIARLRSALRVISLRELLRVETDDIINVFIPKEMP